MCLGPVGNFHYLSEDIPGETQIVFAGVHKKFKFIVFSKNDPPKFFLWDRKMQFWEHFEKKLNKIRQKIASNPKPLRKTKTQNRILHTWNAFLGTLS